MTFNIASVKVTLDSSLSRTSISLKSVLKAFRAQGEGVLLELGNVSIKAEATLSNPLAIISLYYVTLLQYSKSQASFPLRAWDHTINL